MSDHQRRRDRRGSFSSGRDEYYMPYASYGTSSAAPNAQPQYIPTQFISPSQLQQGAVRYVAPMTDHFATHSASGYTEGLYSTVPTHYTNFNPATGFPQPWNQFDSTPPMPPPPKTVSSTAPSTSFSRVSTPDYEREAGKDTTYSSPKSAKAWGTVPNTPTIPQPSPPTPETSHIPLASLKLNDQSPVSIGYPAPGDKSAACQLCDWHGHTAKTCPLIPDKLNITKSDKKDDQKSHTQPANEAVFTSREQNEYQELARKVSRIIQNVVPDSNQPPATNETMMQHIMKCLSSHPGNPEYVHKQLEKKEHQGHWLCIKAMCDNKWEGPVSMATREVECKYCTKNLTGDPVTLCYQIKPRRGGVALYREVGTLRI
ncbi:hypothetical protein B0T20DRAFT_480113 [Sordaria brevicollis]|uniref:Uncharacterized protein n=1 Tax=Sordaria brevicollis TaxID=83679 RepID=A0AAE0PDM0_SORBR|nr:hypothetical protein B0T20DRAFT_480113 [Sordaria brevicollis]